MEHIAKDKNGKGFTILELFDVDGDKN